MIKGARSLKKILIKREVLNKTGSLAYDFIIFEINKNLCLLSPE